MTYLVDSDWVADWLAGRHDAIQLLSELSQQGLSISLMSYGEIYEGVYFSRDPQRSEAVFRQFLRGTFVVPVTRRIMKRFARIRGELRSKGLLISDPDLLIAATALEHGLTLVTRNLSHFERVPNLHLYHQQ